jgi:glycosyltransferase involved in cell wall biosynthesis
LESIGRKDQKYAIRKSLKRKCGDQLTMKKRKLHRILYIGNYPLDTESPLTGPQRVTYNIVGGVKKTGSYNIVVILPHRVRHLFYKNCIVKEKNDFAIVKIHIVRLLALIKRFRPNIIHVSGISYFGMFSLLSKVFIPNVYIIYTAHGLLSCESALNSELNFSLLDKLTEKLLFKYSNSVTTVSELAKKVIAKFYNSYCSKKKIIVIPNSFDQSLRKYPVSIQKFKNQFANSDVKIILFIGKLIRQKGLKFLFNALKCVKYQNYKVVIIGNRSNYWSKIKSSLKEDLLTKIQRIDQLPQKELINAYAACDILVLPSEFETFGLVALEAIAFGKPVIISDRVGFGCYLESYTNIKIVKYNDTIELANTIDELLSKPKESTYFNRNESNMINKFNNENITQKFIELYNMGLLSAKKPHM